MPASPTVGYPGRPSAGITHKPWRARLRESSGISSRMPQTQGRCQYSRSDVPRTGSERTENPRQRRRLSAQKCKGLQRLASTSWSPIQLNQNALTSGVTGSDTSGCSCEREHAIRLIATSARPAAIPLPVQIRDVPLTVKDGHLELPKISKHTKWTVLCGS